MYSRKDMIDILEGRANEMLQKERIRRKVT